jgi:HEAT repeat protein
VVREKGGLEGGMIKWTKAVKEKDVETLTELLGHEIWQVRLRSLQVLDKFLDNDREGLKEVAGALKNDENPEVRQEAERILKRIEAKKKSAEPNSISQ